MKILLIDDLRDFANPPATAEVTVVRTSEEAVELLTHDLIWDEIWLDHDLGEVNGVNDTIMPVVDHLAFMGYAETNAGIGVVYVHTSNPVGRKQMNSTLTRFGYVVRNVSATDHFKVEAENQSAD